MSIPVSIVITNYNGLDLLPTCLNSIEAQDYPDCETIVVDDCSSDASPQLVRSSYPWVRLIRNPENLGSAAAKNVGLEAASHELVAFLDNDTALGEDWLRRMVAEFTAHENVAIATGKILLADNRAVLNSTGGFVNLYGYAWDRGIYQFEAEFRPQDGRVLYACGAAMMARRSVLRALGGFDARYRYPFEDVDMGWRANLAGYEVRYNSSATAFHQLSATMRGVTANRKLYMNERARLRTLLKNMAGPTLKDISRDLIRQYRHALQECFQKPGYSARQKLAESWVWVAALFWNAAHLRDTLRWRRQVNATRKVSDRELMDAGLLLKRKELPREIVRDHLPDYQPRSEEDIGTRQMKRLNMLDGCGDYLGPGWHNREFTPDYRAFRWTKSEAVAYLVTSAKPSGVTIQVIAAHPEGTRGELLVNGLPIKRFHVENESGIIRAPLPDMEDPRVYELKLRIDNPFVADEEYGNHDTRRLGLAVSRIEVGP